MTPWNDRPPTPHPCHERLATARDVAIIAVCVAILAFAFLAVWGSPPARPERPASPAPAHVAL
ncbi:MAG TPA: hypothetical protein VIW03_04190 [Anaeromyxobacter sp.]